MNFDLTTGHHHHHHHHQTQQQTDFFDHVVIREELQGYIASNQK
jgi:hypothetical protein